MRFVLLSLAALMSLSTPAAARPGALDERLASILQAVRAHDEVPVLVRLADRADLSRYRRLKRRARRRNVVRELRRHAEVSQRPIRALIGRRAARRSRQLWLINGLALSANPALIRRLAAHPRVESIRLDGTFAVPVSTPSAVSPAEWNLETIGAPALWNLGIRGSGVVVANMDTGVDLAHPDIEASWRAGGNSWFDPYGGSLFPYDLDGHGTQTMGLMVGGSVGGTAIGVAPGASWIAAKIFNGGVATYGAIHESFQWLADPDGDPATDDAPDIVNNSWGLPQNLNECVSEFDADVQALRDAGIVVVFAGGNSGPNAGTSLSPANGPGAYPVGSVNSALEVSGDSSRGPSACDGGLYPKIVAPGAQVLTCDLSFGGLPLYASVSGTSFAAPHVSGALALLKSAFPSASAADLESALSQTAFDLGGFGPDKSQGHGLVDVVAAHQWLSDALECRSADALDSDADGVPDICDSCRLVANPQQRDSDGDGFGNLCDPDLDQSGFTDLDDVWQWIGAFMSSDPHADFNGDGIVNFGDIWTLILGYLLPPGPAGPTA